MRAVHVIEIKTPTGVLLNGLWFGPKRPKRVAVLIHGLMSTAFSMRRVLALVDSKTAVVTFNNRGFGLVNYVTRERGNKSEWILAGSAHEKFTDSVDDIEGVLKYVRAQGVSQIYLVGHSTGCQKAVYYASRTRPRYVRGIILLAPISDYASQRAIDSRGSLKKATAIARNLVQAGKPHELMPRAISGEFQCDAQRFLSLYSGEGPEEVFPYWDPARTPAALNTIRLPILTLLAEKDEYADRPAEDMAAWFLDRTYAGEVVVIPGVEHSFRGAEPILAKVIDRFMRECYDK